MPCRGAEKPDLFAVDVGKTHIPVKRHHVKGGMLAASRLVREVEKIPGYKLYGFPKWEYAYAVDQWPYGTPVPYDASKIKTAYIDIEVKSDEGFPEPTDARHPVTAITIATKDKTIALGYKDYTGSRLKNYVRCLDEQELLRKFIYLWQRLDFDILSGWNCLPVGSWVWGAQSLYRIGDLVGGESLFDTEVVAKSPESNKTQRMVKLSNGMTFVASGDHRIPVRHCDPDDYTKLTHHHRNCGRLLDEDLRVDDVPLAGRRCFVELPIHENVNEDDNDYPDHELYLAGLIFTDGTLKTKSKPTDGYTVWASDRPFLETLNEWLGLKIGGDQDKGWRRHIPRNKLGKSHDLIYSSDNIKKLNVQAISCLSRRQFMILLSGMLDGDGLCGHYDIGICNYKGHLDDIETLARWNGLFTVRRSEYTTYFLDLKFADLMVRKSSRWNNYRSGGWQRKCSQQAKKTRWKRVGNSYYVAIERIDFIDKPVEMCDIQTTTGYFVTNGVRVHNCRRFDIPYLMQRLERLWGKEPVFNEHLQRVIQPKPVGAALSPWNRCSFYEMSEHGRTYLIYKIPGVAIVDYLDLYVKYGAKSRPESFKLDFIAGEELKERKLDYSGFGSIHEMYERDFNRFMDYNAHDAELVMKLESKRNLIGLVIDVAYMAKCQFEDVMHQTRLWDSMAYAKLRSKGMTVPALRPIVSNEGVDIAGAFVKPPYIGMHNWLCSLDVTSEYPSAMMQWNISPETLVTRQRLQEYRARVAKKLAEMTT